MFKAVVFTVFLVVSSGCMVFDFNDTPVIEVNKIDEALSGELKLLAKDANVIGALKNSYHVDFKGREGAITWTLEHLGEGGHYHLEFLYALNYPQKSRYMDLYINGKMVSLVKFTNTGSWHYKWQKSRVMAFVEAGINQIKLVSRGSSAPNLKALIIRDNSNN